MWGTRDKTIEDIVLNKIADIKLFEKLKDEFEELIAEGNEQFAEDLIHRIIGEGKDVFNTLTEVQEWVNTHQDLYEGLIQRAKRIEKMAKKVDEKLDAKINTLESKHDKDVEYLKEAIDALDDEIRSSVSDLNDYIDKVDAKLNKTAGELGESIGDVNKRIDHLKDIYDGYFKDVRKEMETAVNDAKTELTTKHNEDIQGVQGELSDAVEDLNNALEGVQSNLEEKYDGEVKRLDYRIDSLKSQVKDKIDAAKDELNGRITREVETLNGVIDEVKETFNNTTDELKDTIDGLEREHQKDCKDIDDKLDRLSEAYKDADENIRKSLNNEITDRQKGDADIELHYKAADAELADEIKDAREKFQKLLVEIETKHDEDIDAVKKDLEEAINKILNDGYAADIIDSFKEVREWVEGHTGDFEGLKELAESLNETHQKDIDDVRTELNELSDDTVHWTHDGDRKHIVLNNHGMLEGTVTNEGDVPGRVEVSAGNYNLAMVSKWNVADFGSSKLPINLNGLKDRRPTYNDTKDIALLDDVIGVQGQFTGVQNTIEKTIEGVQSDLNTAIEGVQGELEGVQSAIEKTIEGVQSDLNTAVKGVQGQLNKDVQGVQGQLAGVQGEIEKTIAGVQTDLTGVQTEASTNLDNAVKGVQGQIAGVQADVKKNYVPWEFGENERKFIVLPNHCMLEGTATDRPEVGGAEVPAGNYNLAMVSKWNVADFGSSKLPINLNGLKDRPTYNDEFKIALVDDVDAAKGALDEELERLEEELGTVKGELLAGIQGVQDNLDKGVQGVQGQIKGVQSEASTNLDNAVQGVQGQIAGVQTHLSGVQSVLKVTQDDLADLEDSTNRLIGNLHNHLKEKLTNVNNRIDGVQANYVPWTENNHGIQSVLLPNHGMIIGTPNYDDTVDGKPLVTRANGNCNLVMLSKWNVADFGSTKYHINLNGLNDRPTYNDEFDIALMDDVRGVQTEMGKAVEDLVAEVGNQASDLNTKIENVQTNLETKVEGVQSTLLLKIKKNTDDINTIITETIPGVQSEIKESIDKVLGGASDAFDTLKEVESWIGTHGTQYSDLLGDLNGIHNTLDGLDGDVKGVQSEMYEKVAGVQSETTTKIDNAVKGVQGQITGVQSETTTKIGNAVEGLQSELGDAVQGVQGEIADVQTDVKKNYVPWTFGEDEGGRKFIVLPNHCMLEGTATATPETGGEIVDAGHYNLAMVSKWNVADFGSHSLPINFNGSKLRPTYNDEFEIALVDDVDAAKTELGEAIDAVEKRLEGKITGVDDSLEGYVTVDAYDKKVKELTDTIEGLTKRLKDVEDKLAEWADNLVIAVDYEE